MREKLQREGELKPCPFCGDEAELYSLLADEDYGIECTNGACGAQQHLVDDRDLVVNRWNRRA